MSYERYLLKNGYNAVVTCGGVHSNHNRAIALMAMRNEWKCHMCLIPIIWVMGMIRGRQS
ncbi:MAG: hypothetical protein KBT06_10575 [Prevotellaceae bacterium]|nr:hypothetical protein [Candidatus Colivivens equi]